MRSGLLLVLAALLSGAVAELQVDSVRVDGSDANGTFVPANASIEIAFRVRLTQTASEGVAASAAQSAYRVIVSSSISDSEAGIGDLWDSLWVSSNVQAGIRLGGTPARREGYVRVQVQDGDGAQGPFSPATSFRVSQVSFESSRSPVWLTARGPKPTTDCDHYQRRSAPLLRGTWPEPPAGRTWASGDLYTSTLGYGTVFVNGVQPDARVVLDPAWTTFAERVLYSAYDVSEIVSGSSSGIVVAVELGNGYWSPVPMLMFNQNLRETLSIVGYPMVWLELHLVDSSGGAHIFSTADVVAWRAVQASAVVFDNVYLGQVTDNRLLAAISGWSQPGFNDSGWGPAEVVNVTTGPLLLQDMPPVKTFTERPSSNDVDDVARAGAPRALLTMGCQHSRACGDHGAPWTDDDDGSSGHESDGLAVRLTRPDSGTWVLDFGSDRTGVVDIESVTGPAGHEVNITFGEILKADGHVNPDSITAASIGRWGPGNFGPCARVPAVPIDTVVLAGTGQAETFRPRFSWRVFRYAQINNWPVQEAGEPSLEQFRRVLMHTDVRRAGHFASGLPLLANIRRMADRAFLNNWVSIQGDCPGRERFGYGGDGLVSGPATTRSWDMERFLRKRIRDYGDAQRANGAMTETAPFMGLAACAPLGNQSGPIAWGGAHMYLLWLHRQQYGGTALADEELARSLKYITLVNDSRVQDVFYDGLGSFVLPRGFNELCNSSYGAVQGSSVLVSQARLAVELLQATGAASDTVARFQAVADTTQAAFEAQIFDPANGVAGLGSMDEQLLALGFGALRADASGALSPPEAQAVAALERYWAGNGSLMVGSFVSLAHQHAVDWGLGERMWAWVTNSSFPSYGYFLEFDATAMPEHWANPTEDFSWSHGWLGSVSQFLTDHVAGLRPGGVGSSSLIAAPQPFGWRAGALPGVVQLPWAAASLLTPRGEMSSSWEIRPKAPYGGPNWLFLNVTLPPSSEASAAFVPLADASMTGNSTCEALPGHVCACQRISTAEASARKIAALGITAVSSAWKSNPFDGWSLENSTGCTFFTAWEPVAV